MHRDHVIWIHCDYVWYALMGIVVCLCDSHRLLERGIKLRKIHCHETRISKWKRRLTSPLTNVK